MELFDLKAQKQQLIDSIKDKPEFAKLVDLIASKTVKWMTDNFPAVTAGNQMADKFSAILTKETSNIGSEMTKTLQQICEAICGAPISVVTGERKVQWASGICVKFTENLHVHNYPLNVPLFVVESPDSTTAKAWNPDGGTQKFCPTEAHVIVPVTDPKEIADNLAVFVVDGGRQAQDFVDALQPVVKKSKKAVADPLAI